MLVKNWELWKARYGWQEHLQVQVPNSGYQGQYLQGVADGVCGALGHSVHPGTSTSQIEAQLLGQCLLHHGHRHWQQMPYLGMHAGEEPASFADFWIWETERSPH